MENACRCGAENEGAATQGRIPAAASGGRLQPRSARTLRIWGQAAGSSHRLGEARAATRSFATNLSREVVSQPYPGQRNVATVTVATNREELKSKQGAMLLLDDKKGKPLSSVGSRRAPSQQTVTFSPGFNTVTPMASGVRWDGEQPGAAAAAIAASGGARGSRGAAAMTESRPRGLETRERRVDCRTRGFPCAYAYGLCYIVQGCTCSLIWGQSKRNVYDVALPPNFLGEETARSRWTS